MRRRMVDQQGLRQFLDPEINPSEETRKLAFKDYFDDVLEDMIEANVDIYKKIVEDTKFGDIFRMVMFKKNGRVIPPRSSMNIAFRNEVDCHGSQL